jgi:hypothetical protein
MVQFFNQTSSLIIKTLLFLLYVVKEISSLNLRERRTILNRIFNPCKVNLTHTLGTPTGRSEATVCLSFRVVEQSHHKRLLDYTHIQCAGHTSVARLHDRIPVCSAERTLTVGACKHKIKVEWWGTSPLAGPIGY